MAEDILAVVLGIGGIVAVAWLRLLIHDAIYKDWRKTDG